ncbi:hypothetical protein BCR33DRAFT_130030 [Rhizoclosmatium globosum]|uniref:Uncharacterized protein n=1 Tax=Rhizoclosmatium globosum TaxID=329046 RepID=A0A1Y2CJK0_9FUNG|nr:hypothetical protein BCR33DRAFT_130030 [Rhizoclosmatium globosum]|eukprot:ORY46505.1 hypothetical protein BCR33DRAFT_130030 [Rhizoclosmatium globosum]
MIKDFGLNDGTRIQITLFKLLLKESSMKIHDMWSCLLLLLVTSSMLDLLCSSWVRSTMDVALKFRVQ